MNTAMTTETITRNRGWYERSIALYINVYVSAYNRMNPKNHHVKFVAGRGRSLVVHLSEEFNDGV
jgi:hypothetical protein